MRLDAPMVAKIGGGDRNAGRTTAITFDCGESSWPDDKANQLGYTWSMDKVGTADTSTPPEPVSKLETLDRNSAKLTIPANFLDAAKYKVTCSVTTLKKKQNGDLVTDSKGNPIQAAASVQVTVETLTPTPTPASTLALP